MKKIIFSLSIVSLLMVGYTESAESNNFDHITPFSATPILKVPHYLYENCNQATMRKISKSDLVVLKEHTRTLSKDKFAFDLRRTFVDVDQKTFTESAEFYDWVNGLMVLEQLCLGKTDKYLTSSSIAHFLKLINKNFSRIIDPKPGEFRIKDICWYINTLTASEKILEMIKNIDHDYNKGILNHEQIEKMTNWVKQLNIFQIFASELNFEINNFEDVIRFVHTILGFDQETGELDSEKVRKVLSVFKDNPELWTLQYDQIDLSEVDVWVNEKSYCKPNTINWQEWFKKRIHSFPNPEDFSTEIDKISELIGNPSIHPIEKAARLWFDIVRIHFWHEANKRTGKALASMILLEHGYLPPVICAADEKPYLKILQDCLTLNDPTEFVKFIAKMIVKTQKAARKNKITL